MPLLFDHVLFKDLELGTTYLIKTYMKGNRCMTKKGIFYKECNTPGFGLFKINSHSIHVYQSSLIYKMKSTKKNIQEAMELRAIHKVLRSLIPYFNYESNHNSK
jgi:hypothetical protein